MAPSATDPIRALIHALPARALPLHSLHASTLLDGARCSHCQWRLPLQKANTQEIKEQQHQERCKRDLFCAVIFCTIFSFAFLFVTASQTATASVYTITPTDINNVDNWNEKFMKHYAETQYEYLRASTRIKSNIIVQIGLDENEATVAAVEHGLIVYAFDPLHRNVQSLQTYFVSRFAELEVAHLDDILTVIDCEAEWSRCNGDVRVEPVRKHATYGHCFLFLASVSDGASKQGTLISDDGHQSSDRLISHFSQNYFRGIARVPSVRIDQIVKHDVLWLKSDIEDSDNLSLIGCTELFRTSQVLMIDMNCAAGNVESTLMFLTNKAKMKMCNGKELSWTQIQETSAKASNASHFRCTARM